MKRWGKRIAWSMAVLGIGAVLLVSASKDTHAQGGNSAAAVTPYSLVSNLDFACHRVEGDSGLPIDSLTIGHLNPVLQEMGLYEQRAYIGELQQLCAPVAKNQNIPPRPELSILRWIDLACYKAISDDVSPVQLNLMHLNPVLQAMGLPPQDAVMTQLEQVCVPVAKNGVIPPDYVRPLIDNVDVACYQIDPLGDSPVFSLFLTHLNPVLRRLGIIEQNIGVEVPNQLCVPVMKNGNKPPEDVLKIVQWMDFLKYKVSPQSLTPIVPLTLQHLNPLFQYLAPFEVRVLDIEQLAVPVAKNGKTPPE